MMPILEYEVLSNTVAEWIVAVAVAAAVFTGLVLGRALLSRQLERLAARTATALDDLASELVGKTRIGFLGTVALYLATLPLELPEQADTVLGRLTVLAVVLQGALWGNHALRFALEHQKAKRGADAPTTGSIQVVGSLGRVLLWSIVGLITLDNLGIDVTALVAGLGIGGLAVALAAQNVLGDLFAYLSVAMDHPIRVGDSIDVDGLMGTVERIGLKSTRLRSLSGEQLIFSNADLLSSRIRNYKRMNERRAVLTLGVTYQTPLEKLAAIPDLLAGIVSAQEKARLERAHFKGFGDSALIFELVFYVLDPNMKPYMDVQQAINLEICREFNARGIEFAYPTQTLILSRAGLAAPSPAASPQSAERASRSGPSPAASPGSPEPSPGEEE